MTPTRALLFFILVAGVVGCGSKTDSPPAGAAAGKVAEGKAPAPAGGAGKPAGPPKGLPVKAVPAVAGPIDLDVNAVGTLLADESVMIRPEIDGRVTEIHFSEGQQVAKGQRLVTLDPSELKAQLAQADAQTRTETQRFTRAQELLAQQFISQEAVDLARNNMARAEALKREAEARLQKTSILAPFSGVVGLRLVSPGAYVKKGDDIARLESISAIKVDFRIPEAFSARAHSGQQMAIRLDAFPNEVFGGQVYAVEPVVDERTRTVLLRGRVQNKGLKLKPGMFVRVGLTMDKRTNAILVPEPAIWPQGRDTFVYRVVDGKAALTKVEIGVRRPGEVEIAHGLSAGDMVVTEGQIKLKDGAPVMVLPSKPPGGDEPAAATKKG